MNPQVDAPVVKDLRRVEPFSRHVGSRQYSPEPGCISQLAGGDVIRMRVFPIRCQDDPRASDAEYLSKLPSRGQISFQLSVRQIQIMPPREIQHFRRGIRFGFASFDGPTRSWFAIGEFNHPHLQSLLSAADDGAAHADLCIVRMRSHDENIKWILVEVHCVLSDEAGIWILACPTGAFEMIKNEKARENIHGPFGVLSVRVSYQRGLRELTGRAVS